MESEQIKAATASKPQTILVVEPSYVTRKLIADVLNNTGYKVIYAIDAKDAVYKLNDEKLDLVLTDVNISVIELLDQLKETRNSRFTPVALLVDKSDKARKKTKCPSLIIGSKNPLVRKHYLKA